MGKDKREDDDKLTQQDKDSFPASDPPSLTQPTSAGAPEKHKSSGRGVEAELARQEEEKRRKGK